MRWQQVGEGPLCFWGSVASHVKTRTTTSGLGLENPGWGPDISHTLSRARILPKGKRVSAPKIRAQSRASVLATSVFK